MDSISHLGFLECYALDIDKIYNKEKGVYIKECAEYRYKLRTKEGNYKSITIKELYKRLYNKVFCIDKIDRLENEEFRVIEGTGGNYLVSNKGRVLSYVGNHAKILKPTLTDKGYERLQIMIEGQRYSKFVHTLVCSAFLDPPKTLDCCIHHIDTNGRNNNIENLVYMTKLEHIKIHQEIRRNKNGCTESENYIYKENNRY